MEDKTIYQKYDELLEANTRLSEEVSSMKFTVEHLEVIKIEEDTINPAISYEGKMVTLKNSTGQTFIVNVPDFAWGDDKVYGLNLVYGKGIHYT